MHRSIGLSLVCTLILSAISAQAQGLSKLPGTYKVISGKRGGKEIPKDHLHSSVRIMEKTMTAFDKENHEAYVMEYRVEDGKAPNRITMTITRSTRKEAEGTKARGLIKLDGDRATLIYDDKGDDYPSDFEPKDDSQHVFVMERTGEK